MGDGSKMVGNMQNSGSSPISPLAVNVSLERIILYVHDVQLLVDFYRDAFELPLVEEIGNEWAVFQAGHCQLALHRVGRAYRTSTARTPVRNSNAKLVMTVPDLDALREKLVARGVPMGAIKSYPGLSGALCDGTDPEGNVFQLAHAQTS